jgi:hypothetical protein
LRACRGLACLVSVLLAGCGGGGGGGSGVEAPLSGNFFPLEVGDRWTYAGDGDLQMTARATAIRRVDGQEGVVVTVDDPADGRSEVVYIVGADGVREVPGAGSDPLLLAVGPVQVMRFPLVPGDSFVQIDRTISTGIDFDSDGQVEQAQVRSEVTMIGAETVTTRAGTFAGAAHLRTTMTARVALSLLKETVLVTITSDDWFAPGVGPVRSVVETRGNGSAERSEWSVLAYRAGSARSESVPPTVARVSPSDGAVQNGSAVLMVSFSEPMDEVSLATAITLTDPAGQPVPLTLTAAAATVSLAPAGGWASGRYQAQVSTAAEDRAGNALTQAWRWSFEIDVTGPVLVGSAPADGAIDVAFDAAIVLRFSEAIDPASVDLFTATLHDVEDLWGSPLPAVLTVSGNEITLKPTTPLERGRRYEVHVRDTLRDLAGNLKGSDSYVRFRADTGRFALPQPLASEGLVDAVAIGDVNGDGRKDVLLTTGYTFDAAQDFKLMVRLQQPDGSLAPAQVLDTRASYVCRASSVVVGDLDGDGRQDVLVGASGCGIEFFRQGGDGVLRSAGFIDSAQSGRLRLADLDGDGRPDLVAAGYYGSVLRVWLQDAGGTMVPHADLAFEYAGDADLDVGDVNGDGRPDIVIGSGSYPDTSIGIFLQQGDGRFGPALTRTPSPPTGVSGLAVGDVNGDGRDDVVVTYGGNGSRLGVMLQGIDGKLGPMSEFESYDAASQVELADVNGDGRRDVVVGHSGWYAVGVYLQQADGSLGAEARYPANYGVRNPGAMAVGDVTGDGRPDILVAEALLQQKVVDAQSLGTTVPGARALTRTLLRLIGGR